MAEEEIKQIFSRNLRHCLEEKQKTQADLAKYLNISTASVAYWCTGKNMPRMDKIQAICNWLMIEKSDLLEEKIDSKPSYYLDDDAKAAADFLHKNPEYKVLFDASRKVKREDIDFVRKMIDKFSD